MNKIALIIQGPIISSGVRGSILRDKNHLTDKNENTFIDYDCMDNVVKLAKNGRNFFDYIVLSTWESEFNKKLSDNNYFDKVIFSNEDSFENVYIKHNIFNQNYKKQFHTLKVASDFLKDKDLDFVVKIRTDLFINLEKLHQECLNALNNETILINNNIRHKRRFLELDDFIFGSESNFFFNWMNNLLNIEFRDWGGSHHRLMIAYLWTKYKNSFKFREILFFHKDIVNNSKSISKKAIIEWEKFCILDKNFWKDSKFRGEDLDTRYYDFHPELPLLEKHKIKYNLKLFFKWFKYRKK